MAQPAFSSKRLDHLGIVAGVCKQLRIAEQIDQQIPAPERNVSHGEAAVAMLINALGFVSRPLYLTPEFWRNKPIELLIRPGIEPEHLNDDALGRTLDAFYDFGVTELFATLATSTLEHLGIDSHVRHLDTTTLSFYGQYTNDRPPEDPDDRHPIEITYGYSKDKRSDLKQATLSVICEHKASIPVWMEALDGNKNDVSSFPETIDAFCEQLEGEEPLFVMDTAFYSKNNVQTHQNTRWVTRVPETLSAVQALYQTDFTEEGWVEADENHSYREIEQDYGGVPQRWLLVYSTRRARRQKATFETKLAKKAQEARKSLARLKRRTFTCEPDAREAIAALERSWKYHRLEAELSSQDHYEGAGRPKKGQAPSHVTWRASGELVEDQAAIAASQQGRGLYVLATSELDAAKVPAESLLSLYKSQNTTVERGFRFLKDPLFFASGVYLQKPSRIMALLMLMTLSLLVYAVAEHQMREKLANAEETVPDQKGKPTSRPTLRRVFQMFEGLELLVIDMGDVVRRQVLNLTDLHRKLLGFLPEEAKTLYLEPEGCGR